MQYNEQFITIYAAVIAANKGEKTYHECFEEADEAYNYLEHRYSIDVSLRAMGYSSYSVFCKKLKKFVYNHITEERGLSFNSYSGNWSSISFTIYPPLKEMLSNFNIERQHGENEKNMVKRFLATYLSIEKVTELAKYAQEHQIF